MPQKEALRCLASAAPVAAVDVDQEPQSEDEEAAPMASASCNVGLKSLEKPLLGPPCCDSGAAGSAELCRQTSAMCQNILSQLKHMHSNPEDVAKCLVRIASSKMSNTDTAVHALGILEADRSIYSLQLGSTLHRSSVEVFYEISFLAKETKQKDQLQGYSSHIFEDIMRIEEPLPSPRLPADSPGSGGGSIFAGAKRSISKAYPELAAEAFAGRQPRFRQSLAAEQQLKVINKLTLKYEMSQ